LVATTSTGDEALSIVALILQGEKTDGTCDGNQQQLIQKLIRQRDHCAVWISRVVAGR
jgi:hypothetical protein